MNNERRRVRIMGMANELGISERKMRELLVAGMPYTQLMGIIWLEPAEVHEWLDKFKLRSKKRLTKKQLQAQAGEEYAHEEDEAKD